MIRLTSGPLWCRLFFSWMHLLAVSCIISAVAAEEYDTNRSQNDNQTDEIDWQKWAEMAEQLWYLPIILLVTLVPFVLTWLIIQIIGISWFANALHLQYKFAAKEHGDVLSCERSRNGGKYLVEISYVRPFVFSEKDTPPDCGYLDGKTYKYFRKTIEMDRWVEPGDAAIEMLVLRNQPTSGMPAEIIQRNIEEFSQIGFVFFSMCGIALIGYMLYLEVQLVLFFERGKDTSFTKIDWSIFGVYNALTLIVSIVHYKKSVREKIEQMNTSLPPPQEKKGTKISKKKINTVDKGNPLLAGGIVVPDCILPATRPLPYKLQGDDATERAGDRNKNVSLMAKAREKTVDPVVFVMSEPKPRRKEGRGWNLLI